MVTGDPGACLGSFEASFDAFEQAGDRRNACLARINLSHIFIKLGDFPRGEETALAARDDADRMELRDPSASAALCRGYALAYMGRLDEARRLLTETVEVFRQHGHARMEGTSHLYLSEVALLAGDNAVAERHARAAFEILAVAPPLRASAMAMLARAMLRQGRTAEALTAAEEALARVSDEGESLVRLVYAEALAAVGHTSEAERAFAAAREHLLTQAARISDPVWRESFLTRVPDNAAILAAVVSPT
jgi:tetratricopeptide (TPR) repeat protein